MPYTKEQCLININVLRVGRRAQRGCAVPALRLPFDCTTRPEVAYYYLRQFGLKLLLHSTDK